VSAPRRRGAASSRTTAEGRIVILASSTPQGRDLVLVALRRRLAVNRAIDFPMLAVEAGWGGATEGALLLSRRQFRAFESDGAFALVWTDHGVRMALPHTGTAPLMRGATLVVPGPATLAIDAKSLARHVAVIAISAEIDRARAALTPRACLARLADPNLRARLVRAPSVEPEAEVEVSRDIGRSIDRLSSTIEALGR
jgi:ribose 1,5-bisphosphokinase PhnN